MQGLRFRSHAISDAAIMQPQIQQSCSLKRGHATSDSTAMQLQIPQPCPLIELAFIWLQFSAIMQAQICRHAESDSAVVVHYHSGGSMKLNACILILAHMVYLQSKHVHLLVAFAPLLFTHIQIDNIRLWRNSPSLLPLLVSSSVPLPIPFTYLESLLCVVRSRPPWPQVARKLTSPSPFQIPNLPGFPQTNCAPY